MIDDPDESECWCGRGHYNPSKYTSCYECFRDRVADLVSCIFCGKKHSAAYPTCFQCRQINGRDEAGRALRFDILIRDRFTCQECGSNESLHIDHIKPCSSSGLAKPWNLQVLCRECNLDKGTEWHFGCKWDATRTRLMHIYFTFGWPLLEDVERKALCQDALDYTEFDWHTHMREYIGAQPSPLPNWAIQMADQDGSADA